LYITNAPGGASNSNSITTPNTIKQGLPWQSTDFAAANIDKFRNPSDSGIAFTVSNIGKEELRINFRPATGEQHQEPEQLHILTPFCLIIY
jgi:hypothetical protein